MSTASPSRLNEMEPNQEEANRDAHANSMPVATGFGLRRLILILCAVALGVFHIFASAEMYPVPGGDASVFMPAAVNLKAGRGLTNSLWEGESDPAKARPVDSAPPAPHPFVGHPPLFQMVVSACMWKSETRNAFIIPAIFNALTLALYAAFVCTAKFTRPLIASAGGFAILVLSLFAVGFFIFIDSGGRPEPLITLILSGAIGVVIWMPQKYWPVCFGIAIGFAAAIHPTHGILFGCLAAILSLHTALLWQAIRKMIFSATVALLVFAILLSLGPYPIGTTLQGLSRHAALANEADYRLSTLALIYLKLAPWTGLYLFGLALALIWCGSSFWRSAGDRTMRSARLAALFLITFAFWFFAIRRPNASYYLLMLAPALALGAFYLLDASGQSVGRHRAALPVWILTIFFSVFSLCLARDVALFIDYKTEGVSFADAQKEFEQVLRSSPQMISVSESLWVLTDEFERIQIVQRGTTAGDLMVLQQNQRGSLSPPEIPGYRLVSHHFISHPPRWFGFPIARTMPGYSFAVFAREISLGENRTGRSGNNCLNHGS